MKITDIKLFIYRYGFLFFISASVFISSCKKDQPQEEVESYPPYIHLSFHNHQDSQHYIYLIETRIIDQSGAYLDENWSENIVDPGQHISPHDSSSFYITMERNYRCEFRFGVITNEGQVIKIYEQEGWYTPVNPYFSREKKDEIDFSVTARTANNGLIYIQDWQ